MIGKEVEDWKSEAGRLLQEKGGVPEENSASYAEELWKSSLEYCGGDVVETLKVWPPLTAVDEEMSCWED